MTTLLYPVAERENCNEVRIKSIEMTESKGIAFAITTNHGCDYVMFSQNNKVKKNGASSSIGIVAGIRTDNTGRILKKFKVMKGDSENYS